MNKLTRISLQNVPALKQMYLGDRVKNACTIVSISNILDRLKKTPDLEERIEFLSLNDSWSKNGTFVLKNESRIYFHSLEDSPYQSVKSALDLIEVKDEITFVSISDRFRPILKDFLWYNNLETTFEQGTVGYHMTREYVQSLPDPKLPDNLEFRNVSLEDVEAINKEYPREGGDNLDYVKNSIKNKETLGIYDKSTNELLAWCFAMDFCSYGMAVVKGHLKRSGIGTILGLELSKRLVNKTDLDLTANVIHGHPTSHKFCQKMGGRKFDTLTWLTAKPKKLEGASRYGLFQIVY